MKQGRTFMEKNTSKGFRSEQGKPPISLVPPEVIYALACNLFRNSEEGGGKYPARNWEQGLSWVKCYDALQRHLLEWYSRRDNDPETGQSHLWHALSNLAFLVTYEERGVGIDDRPPPTGLKSIGERYAFTGPKEGVAENSPVPER